MAINVDNSSRITTYPNDRSRQKREREHFLVTPLSLKTPQGASPVKWRIQATAGLLFLMPLLGAFATECRKYDHLALNQLLRIT